MLVMNISLTPEQEYLIRTKLQTGKYRNEEEILEIALKLFENVGTKIDAAIAIQNTPPRIEN